MNPMPDPTAALRPYAGNAERGRPIVELRAGAHDGSARVTPIRMGRGSGRWRWSIDVTWRGGPPMHGFPPLPLEAWEDRDPPERHDMLLVDDQELAKAIATAAIDELRAGRAPDTRALKRRFETTNL